MDLVVLLLLTPPPGPPIVLLLVLLVLLPLVPSMSGRRALRAVLVDLSGTLHIEDTAVAGAQEALSRWAPTVRRTLY